MKSKVLKNSIADAVFNSQDLGSATIEKAIIAVANDEYPSDIGDPLTSYLISSILNSDTLDDFVMDIDYAISMLQRAKYAAENNPLVIPNR